MPYKIPGQPGTWYEPGTRKGNATIAWRGQLPDGKWTELVTNATHQPGAQAFVRTALERWHRDRPPAAGDTVDLETAVRHYKDAGARSDEERGRADRLVRYLGAATPIAAINQSHVTAAARAYRAERAKTNAEARAAKPPRQAFPPPSAETVNREITTPLRAVVHFAARQLWRPWIQLAAVKPQEGERPRPGRRAARDADVARILQAIEQGIAACRPTDKGRDKAARRKAANLRALKALVILVHERGYRISEWLRWDWEMIDLPAARARMMISKPDRWVEFEMSPEAVAALAEIGPCEAGRVFPWHGRWAVYGAVDGVAPAGIHWRPHDSRRAVVTAVLRQTGDPALARDYVAHASLKTTLRYRVVEPEEVGPGLRRRPG